MGVDEALWLHSHAGKEPRPTHLANDGKRYKISEGWYDPDPRVTEVDMARRADQLPVRFEGDRQGVQWMIERDEESIWPDTAPLWAFAVLVVLAVLVALDASLALHLL